MNAFQNSFSHWNSWTEEPRDLTTLTAPKTVARGFLTYLLRANNAMPAGTCLPLGPLPLAAQHPQPSAMQRWDSFLFLKVELRKLLQVLFSVKQYLWKTLISCTIQDYNFIFTTMSIFIWNNIYAFIN